MRSHMKPIMFTCPQTSEKVQHWLDEREQPTNEEAYESFSCPACAGLHFINRKTGMLLGAKK
jgi:hypothetical protein